MTAPPHYVTAESGKTFIEIRRMKTDESSEIQAPRQGSQDKGQLNELY